MNKLSLLLFLFVFVLTSNKICAQNDSTYFFGNNSKNVLINDATENVININQFGFNNYIQIIEEQKKVEAKFNRKKINCEEYKNLGYATKVIDDCYEELSNLNVELKQYEGFIEQYIINNEEIERLISNIYTDNDRLIKVKELIENDKWGEADSILNTETLLYEKTFIQSQSELYDSLKLIKSEEFLVKALISAQKGPLSDTTIFLFEQSLELNRNNSNVREYISFLTRNGRCYEAMPLYKWEIYEFEQLIVEQPELDNVFLGYSYWELANCCGGCACCSNMLIDSDCAEEYYNKAIKIFQDAGKPFLLGSDTVSIDYTRELGELHYRLADVYLKTNMMEKAIQSCDTSIRLRESLFASKIYLFSRISSGRSPTSYDPPTQDSLDIASSYEMMALIHIKKNMLDEALKHLKKSLSIIRALNSSLMDEALYNKERRVLGEILELYLINESIDSSYKNFLQEFVKLDSSPDKFLFEALFLSKQLKGNNDQSELDRLNELLKSYFGSFGGDNKINKLKAMINEISMPKNIYEYIKTFIDEYEDN